MPGFRRTFALLLVAAGGCGLLRMLGLEGRPARPFSHRQHGEKEDLECEVCHSKYAQGDEAGMPASLKKCMLCHEKIDEGRPAERKLGALYPEPLEWSQATALSEEIIFSHKVHHEKKVACGECHKGAERNAGHPEDLRVGKDACMGCHAERGAPNECASCHKEIRKDSLPGTHRLAWKRVHGGIVRAGGREAAGRCDLCHTEASCATCHQDEAPVSHTNFWRLQGHAVAAGVDRSACATCHRSDYCDRCHRETPPRSHVGSFGSPQNRHCLSCHGPVGSQRPCFTCHLGARHETAPPRPANAQHAGATEAQCRTCHTIIGLPHPDNGDTCGACH